MQRDDMMALFLLAGIRVDNADQLPNGYWPDCPEYAEIRAKEPWWLVHSEWGMIIIGWRKRVISINWERTGHRGVVTNDDVTRDESMVHAYSYAKAVEYLTSFAVQCRRAAALKEKANG